MLLLLYDCGYALKTCWQLNWAQSLLNNFSSEVTEGTLCQRQKLIFCCELLFLNKTQRTIHNSYWSSSIFFSRSRKNWCNSEKDMLIGAIVQHEERELNCQLRNTTINQLWIAHRNSEPLCDSSRKKLNFDIHSGSEVSLNRYFAMWSNAPRNSLSMTCRIYYT